MLDVYLVRGIIVGGRMLGGLPRHGRDGGLIMAVLLGQNQQ
jgi:hypothetical protein